MANSFGSRKGGQDKTLVVVFSFVFFILIMIGGLLFVYFNSLSSEGDKVNTNTEVIAPRRMVEVLVPIRDIPTGTKLEQQMFRKEERDAATVDDRTLNRFEEIQNMYSRGLLPGGIPVIQDFITNVRPSSQLTTVIPTGYRAVSINVNATSSVEGWAEPGSKVDVHWITTKNNSKFLKTIVKNAKVISAQGNLGSAEKASPSATVPTTITLLVTSKDAKKILLAQQAGGALSLSLRGDADSGIDENDPDDMSGNDVLGTQQRSAPTRPNSTGIVIIDGQEWSVNANGKLVPLERN